MSLYPPPQYLETTLFTSVPAEFDASNVHSDWVSANKPGQLVSSFLEGPSFDRDGNLYVVDIPFGRIFRITPNAEWILVCDYDGWPNGLRLHQDGRIFIADYKNGIMILDPVSGKIEPFLTHAYSEGFKGINDLVFDSKGRLYFTDQGQTGMQDPTGRVFCYDPNTDRLDCLIDTCPSPNGLVFNPEETILFVAMTRSNAIWRLPLLRDGRTSKVGIFAQLAGGVSGADGLAMDVQGNLTVCDAGNGCVWMFSKWAEPLYRIRSSTGGRTTTNLAYGGPDNKSIFITESDTGNILCADLQVSGQTMFGLA